MTSLKEQHPDYLIAAPDLFLVRKFVDGEAAVKREGSTFLPHPNQLECNTPEQKRRYESYKMGAEVEDFPARTLNDLLGAMFRQPAVFVPPVGMEYLVDDSDGDWLSLQASIELTARNCLQVGYHILLAEYDQLPSDLDVELSIADKAALNQKASIKHYPRESLVDWSFGKVNGRLTLTFAKLQHNETRKDEKGQSFNATVCLELGIDELGYWQELEVYKNGLEVYESAERVYPQANGKNLTYIPIEIVQSARMIAGQLPIQAGYIAPLCYKAHARYQVSADLKERLRILQDTSYSSGWDESKKEEFNIINGRGYFAMGAGVHNFLPGGVTMDILKLTADGDALFKYMEENAKQIRAIGGRFDTQDKSQETLGEVQIKDANEKAVLTLLTNNIERAYKNLICYCGEFEGMTLMPSDIELTLNREFTSNKITTEEVKSIRELVLDRLMTPEMAVEKLIKGGFLVGEAQDIMNMIEQQGVAPVLQK